MSTGPQPTALRLSGSDYTAGSGTLNFTGTAGETQTITVSLTDEYVIESDETFFVNLSNLVTSGNAVIADPQGMATIVDDEVSITVEGTAAADDFQIQLNADGVTLEGLERCITCLFRPVRKCHRTQYQRWRGRGYLYRRSE